MKGNAVFLDTTIQIARFFREKELKDKINKRLSEYSITVTSSVVLQEFKRRILSEAIYLLNQLNDKGSYQAVSRHISNVLLHPGHHRKQQICLQLLHTIFEKENSPITDEDLTERAKSYLRTLLKHGIGFFLKKVDHLLEGTNCYLSQKRIVEKEPYKRYELVGGKSCSGTNGKCEIVQFLVDNHGKCKLLLEFLKKYPSNETTDEIKNSINFLDKFIEGQSDIRNDDPCLTVGDLLIALESAPIPVFYTMNYQESKFFCKFLEQTLIIRPNSPQKDDKIENHYL